VSHVLALVADPAASLAAIHETATTPYTGVRHVVRVDDALPTRAHILEIDLTQQELRLAPPPRVSAVSPPRRGPRPPVCTSR